MTTNSTNLMDFTDNLKNAISSSLPNTKFSITKNSKDCYLINIVIDNDLLRTLVMVTYNPLFKSIEVIVLPHPVAYWRMFGDGVIYFSPNVYICNIAKEGEYDINNIDLLKFHCVDKYYFNEADEAVDFISRIVAKEVHDYSIY